MLSIPSATEGLINIFEVNPLIMAYDTEAMADDIPAYGLFIYEEFYELIPIPEVIFDAFNGQYLKVSIGKGLTTIEKIRVLVVRYSKFFTADNETDGADTEDGKNNLPSESSINEITNTVVKHIVEIISRTYLIFSM